MLMNHTKNMKTVIIGERNLSLDEIIEIARENVTIEISSHPNFIKRMEQSKKILIHSLETDLPVYGVTTGFGKSCGKRMSAAGCPFRRVGRRFRRSYSHVICCRCPYR